MNPSLAAALFATLAVLVNWHFGMATLEGDGATSFSIDGAGLLAVASLGAFVWYARLVYREVRRLLAEGIRVPMDSPLFDLRPCFILMLMLLNFSSNSVIQTTDASLMTVNWGYGSPAAPYAVVFGAAFLILFQIHCELRKYRPHRNELDAVALAVGEIGAELGN